MNISQFDQDIATLQASNIQISNGYHLSGSDRADLAGALARLSGKLGAVLSDTDKLTAELIEAGADRAKVITIVDGYGDAIDWSYHSLDSIIAEVWQSDLNSGDDSDGWIINEICRSFNVPERTE